ncbi:MULTISPECIES: helix-turn-helix transcriptional regulator [Actinotignum]|uniref:helix-turn-helix transcriptional regulator n=1 Tax=Actinotignum TaxID=1653174 RepID=UPI00237DE9A8|nr:transcriptional regulator [Actinotignum sanguinis]MDE1552259.1 transcriptional regulator [Actinotignum sanguinis]MDE1643208.1 transcriptional regulator [Actinotignum sanguinis]
MTTRYLTTGEAAQRLGIQRTTFTSYVQKGLTPPPDAITGTIQGWLPETIDDWNANRPGRGARTDLKDRSNPGC